MEDAANRLRDIESLAAALGKRISNAVLDPITSGAKKNIQL